MDDIEFHVTPRYLNNQFGYAIITPLKLTDGRIVLVNRGWVPADKKLAESRPDSRVHGHATITGLIRTDRDRSYFTPENQPEKNIWFARDIDAMAAYAQLAHVVPAMVDEVQGPGVRDQRSEKTVVVTPARAPGSALQTPNTMDPGVARANLDDNRALPIPSDGVIRLRNDHLSYIITWYGIALGILVIFVTYHRKK